MATQANQSTGHWKGHLTRRDLLRTAIVGAGGWLLASCAQPAAQPAQQPPGQATGAKQFQGKELHVLTWSDSTGQSAVKNIVKPFEQKTGAKVVPDLVGATSEMVAKVKASKGNQWADVVILSGVGGPELQREGLLDQPDPAKIPNLVKVAPQFQFQAKGFAVGYNLWPTGMIYNNKAMSEPPSTWEALWDEKFKGKLFTAPPTWIDALDTVIMAAMLSGGDQYNPEPGFKKLEQLKGRILLLGENAAQVAELMRTGELLIGGGYGPQGLSDFLVKKDYPIGVALGSLKEGFFADCQIMVIPKGHPGDSTVAHAFMSEALSTEAQTAMAKEVFYTPINKEVVLPEDLKKNDLIVTADKLDKVISPNLEHLAGVRASWSKRLTEIYGKG
ncbi:MAG: ABC transporter substrate-binding protein [Chloroflexi bacterium]|nr:ABC transporter substrate-binding protein [Chloroflexota bacterium]